MTLLDPTVVGPPLAAAMREGSQAEHRAAEGSVFVSELLAGRIGAAGYTAYLLRLRSVYDALEATGREHRDHRVVAAVHDPALERVAALDADLEHWSPGGPRRLDPGASPAATTYAARVRATADDPVLYLAHHYTRYLGDLSGGQAIGRILDREHHLAGAGVAFYDFAGIDAPKRYKDAYRARLDALALSRADTARVVAEVRVAFGLNQALLAELGRVLGLGGRGTVGG